MRTAFEILALWFFASFDFALLWALCGSNLKRAREAETDWSFPGKPFRIIEHMTLEDEDFDKFLTPIERMEARQTAARSVG